MSKPLQSSVIQLLSLCSALTELSYGPRALNVEHHRSGPFHTRFYKSPSSVFGILRQNRIGGKFQKLRFTTACDFQMYDFVLGPPISTVPSDGCEV